MSEMLPLEKAIVLANEERILSLRIALNSRAWHPADPMKFEIEQKLGREEASLRERLLDLSR